jgi:integrase
MGRERANGEGTLYEDKGRGRWVGAITIEGRRRKIVAKTKTEARKRLDALRHDADQGAAVGDGNATLNDAIDRWESRVLAGRNIAPSTREVYAWCCSTLRAELGTKRLRVLSIDQVESAFDRLADPQRRSGRPLSRSALIKVRSVLGMVLDFAEKRGMATRNVARSATLTPAASRPAERKSLTPTEVRRLRTHLETERLGPMFLVMATIGLRPGEATGLLWSDVNLKAGTVTVNHAVRMDRGRPVLSDEVKTKGSRRTVTLPAATLDALKAHKVAQAVERLAATTWADDRLVFATRVGTVLSPSNVRRELDRICLAAKVSAVNPNELRHSAASLLSDAGVPLEQIADVLGHGSTRMLDSTYRHRVRPSVTAAVAAMDAMLEA